MDRTRPEDFVGQPLPDRALTAADGTTYPLRRHVGQGPSVLFFLLRNGTPGWVRELREFRAHHDAFREHGVFVAAVSRDRAEENLKWAARLQTPFPLLADEDGSVMRALAIVRPVPIGPWTLEYFRRTTLLVDTDGTIAAVWGKVRIRGHAQEVLRVALASLRSFPPRA